MTDSEGAAADFDQVVAILERRARLVLARWASLGTNHVRITGGGRIGDGELDERFTRLRRSVDALPDRLNALPAGAPKAADAPSIAGLIDNARAALAFERPADHKKAVVEAWAVLLEAVEQIGAALTREAAPLGDCLPQLTPDEIDGLAEAEADEGRDPAPLRRIARMAALRDDIALMASEAREILSGRFHRIGGRGAPEKIRSRRLVAHLLGAAEGLGLKPSRNRVPARARPGRSAADAVLAALAALRQCKDSTNPVTDPVARAILAECPPTFEAIEVGIIPVSDADPDPKQKKRKPRDPLLVYERRDGRERVLRWTGSD